MQKIKFETDYQEGAHPKILERLLARNCEQISGYGDDTHTKRAKDLIRRVIGRPDAGVFFVVGGTQANSVVIDFLLKPFEAVVCVTSGHINTHEAGAVESTGHKIFALPGKNGLLDVNELKNFLKHFYSDPACEHSAQPKVVYVSYSSWLPCL